MTRKLPRPKINQLISVMLSIFILVMLLSQLFTFEKVPELLVAAGLPETISLLVSSFLVIVEMLSLPYLLKMDISKKVMSVSRVSGFISLGVLSILECFLIMSGGRSMIFGATISLSGSVWTLSFLMVLWVFLIKVNIGRKVVKKSAKSK